MLLIYKVRKNKVLRCLRPGRRATPALRTAPLGGGESQTVVRVDRRRCLDRKDGGPCRFIYRAVTHSVAG